MVVDDCRGSSTFANESFARRSRCGQMWQHHLDGDEPVQGSFKRLEDNPHATATNDSDNFVNPDSPQLVRIVGRSQKFQHDLQRLVHTVRVIVGALTR